MSLLNLAVPLTPSARLKKKSTADSYVSRMFWSILIGQSSMSMLVLLLGGNCSELTSEIPLLIWKMWKKDPNSSISSASSGSVTWGCSLRRFLEASFQSMVVVYPFVVKFSLRLKYKALAGYSQRRRCLSRGQSQHQHPILRARLLLERQDRREQHICTLW